MIKCKECDREFTNSQAVKAHMRVHRGSAGFMKDGQVWNKGQTGVYVRSEETRKKISETSTGRSHSDETKKILSKKRSAFLLAHPEHHTYNYKDSKSERTFAKHLESWSIKFERQYHDAKWGRPFRSDFYLPDLNCIVEVNGTFKYTNGELQEYYQNRTQIIESSGYLVLNINHLEAWFLTKDEVLRRIAGLAQR